MRFVLFSLILTLGLGRGLVAEPVYPWLSGDTAESLAARVAPPEGYSLIGAAPGSYAEWLRTLPLEPGHGQVHLYDGRSKRDQSVHVAVVKIDVGSEDLQQCADAVIRLRAEYLFSAGRDRDIAFHFTSGNLVRWTDWMRGTRPHVWLGRYVTFARSAGSDSSYQNFRRYLDTIFRYAGTASLKTELRPVADPTQVEPGDVFVQGGHPGHAVTVIDVAENAQGERVFLLAQGFMPAQDIHLLRNPQLSGSPWYSAHAGTLLNTPEWRFLLRTCTAGQINRRACNKVPCGRVLKGTVWGRRALPRRSLR